MSAASATKPRRRINLYPATTLPAHVRAPFQPGARFYMPPAPRAFHLSRARRKALIGGLNSSKTFTFIREALRLAHLNRGTAGVLVEPTYPDVRDNLVPKFRIALRAAGLEQGRDWTYNKQESTFFLYGGEERGGMDIRLRHGQQEAVGYDVAWAGLDEPHAVAYDILRALDERVRDPRASVLCTFMCGTPNIGSWLKGFRDSEAGARLWEWHRASTLDNPFASQDYIDAIRAQRDAQGALAMLEGEFVAATGSAYRSFKNALFSPNDERQGGNIRPSTYDPSVPVVLAVDNNRTPLAAALMQHEGEKLVVFSEVTIPGGWWEGLAEAVHARLGGQSPPAFILAGDPVLRGHVVDERTDWGAFASIQSHLLRLFPQARFELKVPKGHPTQVERLEAVNGALCSAAGVRRLLFDPSCRECILDCEQVETDENGGIKKGKGVDPARTHHLDAVGYYVAETMPVRGSGWRPPPMIHVVPFKL